MPELPEVETTLRGVAPVLRGRTIESVEVLRPSMVKNHPTFAKRLKGKRVLDIRRHGKYLWMELSEGLNLMLHLRMSGRLGLRKVSDTPLSRERIRFSIGEDLVLVFNDPRTLGRLWIIEGNDVMKDPAMAKLGPDALTVTEDIFLNRLRKKRGTLKSVLLNQSFIAGVGNIYGDEACFLAKIDPRRNVSDLSDAEKKRLYKSVVKTLEHGIRNMGTSFSDFADLFGKPGKNQLSLMVYGRRNQECRACKTKLRSTKIAQRTTVWCPGCQK